MKGFLLAIGTMLVVLCSVDLTFRYSPLAQRLDAESLFNTKLAGYVKSEPAIVFAGDSRIYHGVSPDAVSAVVVAETGKKLVTYNYGLPFGHACTMLLFADRVVELRRHLPRVVVLAPSPIMWSSPTVVPSDVYFASAIRLSDVVPLVLAASSPEETFADVSFGLFKLEALRTQVLAVLSEPRAPGAPGDIGVRGWVSLGERVDAATQDTRARGRANGYTPGLHSNNGKASAVADRYLRAAIKTLQRSGIRVALIGAPQARQLDINHDGASIYADYVEHLTAIAREFSIPFMDMNAPPVVDNVDFEDGDHLSEPGATKFSWYVAHNIVSPLVGAPTIDTRTDCHVVFDFDDVDLPGWELTGEAFGRATCPGAIGVPGAPPTGYLGPRFLSSRNDRDGDELQGTAASPPFTLDAPMLRLRINGGGSQGLEVVLQIEGVDRFNASGAGAESMSVVEWDVSAYRGAAARLVVRDRTSFGHIGIDDVRLCPGR